MGVFMENLAGIGWILARFWPHGEDVNHSINNSDDSSDIELLRSVWSYRTFTLHSDSVSSVSFFYMPY